MKLATWKINSVRLRIAQVLKFLKEQPPDVLYLQEIKTHPLIIVFIIFLIIFLRKKGQSVSMA